jgi:hypothetical protein
LREAGLSHRVRRDAPPKTGDDDSTTAYPTGV